MRMVICNVHTMVGLLMVPGLVRGSLRHLLRDRKLELLGHPRLVPPGFQPWYLKVCSLCGLMKKGGKELMPPNLHCKHSSDFCFVFYSIMICLVKVWYTAFYSCAVGCIGIVY